MTPLGLAHLMGTGHHYGPAPWVSDLDPPDINPAYYHRADGEGIGFDRTANGSNAVAQYSPEVRDMLSDRSTVPEQLLLFLHHVGWNEPMGSEPSLWNELCARYSAGVESVRAARTSWSRLEGAIDRERFDEVAAFLKIEADEARWWRDASLTYFQTFSRLDIPADYEPPAHPLEFYRGLRCPVDPAKPRCPAIYTPDR